jgi:hypothetical protein
MFLIKYKRILIAGFLLAILLTVYSCDGIFPTAPHDNLLPDHTRNFGGVFHKETGKDDIDINDCYECHTEDLKGMVIVYNGVRRWTPSCLQCHGRLWERKGSDKSKKID